MTEQNRKTPVPGSKNESRHDRVKMPSSLVVTPRVLCPQPVGSSNHSFIPCAPRGREARYPSPQVKGQNDRQDHPQEKDKGKPGLHEPPYAYILPIQEGEEAKFDHVPGAAVIVSHQV